MEIAFGFRLNEAFKFRLGYLRGRVSGRDSLVSSLAVRNLHFRSPISDIRLMANVDVVELFRKIWPGKLMNSREYRRNLIGPDLIMGLGMVKMNPKGNYQGDWVALQALGTEGQFIEGEDNPTPYKLWQFNLKIGGGVGYRINPQWHIELEVIYHVLFTDYLDDVSGFYPKYDELIKTNNGELASYFSYGGRDPQKLENGRLRGNPDANDGFVTMGIRLIYVFNRNQVEKIFKL